jgi:hypothetical protein
MKTCGFLPDGRTRCKSTAVMRLRIICTDGKNKSDRLIGVEVCSEHMGQDWPRVEIVRLKLDELLRAHEGHFKVKATEAIIEYVPIESQGVAMADQVMQKGQVNGYDPKMPVEIVRDTDLSPELIAQMGFLRPTR